ncbi:hypothetical protein MRX96_005747 [Rhipicephalus microplus]
MRPDESPHPYSTSFPIQAHEGVELRIYYHPEANEHGGVKANLLALDTQQGFREVMFLYRLESTETRGYNIYKSETLEQNAPQQSSSA